MNPQTALGKRVTTENCQRKKLRTFTDKQLDQIVPLRQLDPETIFEMKVVSNVLPFRVNQYVIDELIDWQNIPNDPIFQLTFPQRDMLEEDTFEKMADLLRTGPTAAQIRILANQLRSGLNPHPAEQQTLNVPQLNGRHLTGIQHKYPETVLFFPSQGQVCHSYCTFCFRWAQFIGDKDLRFATKNVADLREYLLSNKDVTDVLITGGDPLVMSTANLQVYLEALLEPGLEHVRTIRLGTKALSYWPYRFVTDPDADDLIMLCEKVVSSGKQLALMLHINHWQEIEPEIVRTAIRRLRGAGVILRAQAPLLSHVNDDHSIWSRLWQTEVELGIYPYYMFVERDTGAKKYFEVPLVKAWEIYRCALKNVSGLARTARGPSMSTGPGKIEIQGVAEIAGEKVFVLRFIQARNPDWVQQPFFARFDETATWLDDLRPAFGASEFFFTKEYESFIKTGSP
jgi:KamA family protein